MQQTTQFKSVVRTVESGYAVPNRWWSPLCSAGVSRKAWLGAAILLTAWGGWPIPAQAAPSDCSLFRGDVTVQTQFSASYSYLSPTNHPDARSERGAEAEPPLDGGGPQLDVAALGRSLLLHRDERGGFLFLRPHHTAPGRVAPHLSLKVGYGQWLADRPLGAWVGNGTALEEPGRLFVATTWRF